MKTLAALFVSLAMCIPAHAADVTIPKKFWGKWCAETPVTGGGGPGFWYYSHNQCNDLKRDYRDQDLTIGPNTIGSCKFIKVTRTCLKIV
jgi:hypothetical protein